MRLDLVYFIKNNDFVKIGQGNPISRLGTAREWSPYPVELLGICICSEKDLHKQFKRYQIREGRGHEWFYLSKEIIDFIKQNAITGKALDKWKEEHRIKGIREKKKSQQHREVSKEDVLDRSIFLEKIKKNDIFQKHV